jgi:hypothetical protein
VYTLALVNVQEQWAQGKTLDPNAPELDHVNQSELLLQPVKRGYTIGTGGPQRQAWTTYGGEGSSQQKGSRRLTPKHHSPSPMTHGPPNCSPPTQRDSSTTVDSDAEDRNFDGAYKPSVPSSAKGKKRRPRSLTPEHPPKVPRRKTGLSTPVLVYRVQAHGGSATPIPTTPSRLVHLSPAGPPPSPMGPSPGVPHQPIPAPVLRGNTQMGRKTTERITIRGSKN